MLGLRCSGLCSNAYYRMVYAGIWRYLIFLYDSMISSLATRVMTCGGPRSGRRNTSTWTDMGSQCAVLYAGSGQWFLYTCLDQLTTGLTLKIDCSPLYQPKKPSVLSVFHRQSIGFLYKVPTVRPSGVRTVGSAIWSQPRKADAEAASSRLYIRVKAVSAGLQTEEQSVSVRLDEALSSSLHHYAL